MKMSFPTTCAMKRFAVVASFLALAVLLLQATGAHAVTGGTKMEITDYPSDISVEKGWLKYVTLRVNNTGATDLHGVTLDVDGLPTGWVELQTNALDLLPTGASVIFAVKITVPAEARTQRYLLKFTAASDEESDEKIAEMRVFGSQSEVVLQEIQTLRGKLNYLQEITNIAGREGKNTTSVREKLDRASEILTVAESYLYKKMYNEDLELLQGASKLLDITEAEIDELPAAERLPLAPAFFNPLASWMPVAAALAGAGIMFVALKSAGRLVASRKREGYLKEIKSSIREAPELPKAHPSPYLSADEYVQEKAKLLRLLSNMESDYRQGALSKESYDELKLKYGNKMAELAGKRKATGGI